MDELWIGIWVLVGLFILGASIIGAIKQYEHFLFWIGRKILIWYWKNKNSWPIELSYSDTPIAVYKGGWASIEMAMENVQLRVRDKHPKTKIDKIGVTLNINGHTMDIYESIPAIPLREYTELTEIELQKLMLGGGSYLLNFWGIADDYFKDLCKGNIKADIYGTLWIKTGKYTCKSNTFNVNLVCHN